MQDRFLKRLRKKAKKGMHGWPIATIAFYGPDASRVTASLRRSPCRARRFHPKEGRSHSEEAERLGRIRPIGKTPRNGLDQVARGAQLVARVDQFLESTNTLC